MVFEPKKTLKIFNNPTLPVTKGLEILSSIRYKPNSNAKTLPPIEKIKHGNNNLVILRNPTEEHIRDLKKVYDIHPLHLEDIVSTVQRPKIDEEADYIFFVFHFPQFNSETNRINSIEVDFFLTQNDLLVVIDTQFQTIEEIIQNIAGKKKEKEKYFAGGPGMLLYRILDNLVDSVFPLIDLFERGIEKIDRDVFADDPRNVTFQLSYFMRNVIFFQI